MKYIINKKHIYARKRQLYCYNIQIYKVATIATTVLQETKPGDWVACGLT